MQGEPLSAESVLRGEVRAGRLCAWSVDCVLASVGRGAPPTKRFPADLTAREVQVLVHVSRGMTNKEISCALQISPRTVQHHVEHIYAKIGVSTRAAAALFAVRNDLVTSDDERADL